jgi:2-polyprenyl-3-methyl-5-hydroxy-6-metoxy-1,4-benzoquinol methylase
MQTDQLIDQLKGEYDSDNAYFELLSSWYNSGQFQRRTAPMIKRLRPYLRADMVALDAGCAAGAMAIELAKAGVQRIDAVDFSATALRFARDNAVRHGVVDRITFFESKLEQLSQIADNTYDLIVAADVIEHIVVPAEFIREMWRVCKPGGILLVETPNTLFRQHPWYPAIEAICRRLQLSESRNLFPIDANNNWERYHVSLLKWPQLVQLVRDNNWEVIQQTSFGWWIQFGAADQLMSWLSKLGSLFGSEIRYYGSTDVLISARKTI